MAKTPLIDLFRGQQDMVGWFRHYVWHEAGLYQALAFLACLGASFWAARWLSVKLLADRAHGTDAKGWALARLPAVFAPLVMVALMCVVRVVSHQNGYPVVVTEVFWQFSQAWLVVQLLAALILPPGWTKGVTVAVGLLFLLELAGVLDHLVTYMDSLALTFSNERISVLEVVQAMLLLAVLLPLINRLCLFIEELLGRVSEVNARVRVLVAKLVKMSLYTLAIVAALDLVGIDIQMLTVFGGALGLGLGFGLQKSVSNLVSGVILLLDNSIKPGDVIEVGGVYGWVDSMNARYASMVTRDGKAFLIPNDELVANRVVNWSFSGPSVRVKIPVSVAYSTDLRQAIELMLRACEDKERVLSNPKPNVLLKEFGDNGVLLELRVWITHPERGVANVASAIQMSIWDFFTQNGVEFPFPQRDLHLKEPLTVKVEGPGGEGKD